MKSERITCDNYIPFMAIIGSQLDSFMFEPNLLHASLSYAFPSKFMRPGPDYRPLDVKVTASNSISKYCVSKHQLEIATCRSSKCFWELIKGPFWKRALVAQPHNLCLSSNSITLDIKKAHKLTSVVLLWNRSKLKLNMLIFPKNRLPTNLYFLIKSLERL